LQKDFSHFTAASERISLGETREGALGHLRKFTVGVGLASPLRSTLSNISGGICLNLAELSKLLAVQAIHRLCRLRKWAPCPSKNGCYKRGSAAFAHQSAAVNCSTAKDLPLTLRLLIQSIFARYKSLGAFIGARYRFL